MKIKNVWAFFAAMVLALLVCETSLFAATIKTKDYWVMRDGYHEPFTTTAGSQNLTVGYGPYRYYINDDVFHVDYPGPLMQFLNYDADGNLLYYGAAFDDKKNSSLWTYTVNYPRVFFPAVMETGKEYKYNWVRDEYKNESPTPYGSGKDNFAITVYEERSVSVPAGIFDTYRIEVVDHWETSTGEKGTSYRIYWLAKGIGWVKMKLDGAEYELRNPPSVFPLRVTPSSLSLAEGGGGSLILSGGTGPYSASSSNPSVVNVMVSGSTVYVESYSAGSASISIQDSASESVSVPVTVAGTGTIPAAPVLSVSTSGLKVTVSWDAVGGATGYIFAYAPYPDAGFYGSGDVGLQRYFSFEMPHGSAYYVWIHAYNSVGWSDPSNMEHFALYGLSASTYTNSMGQTFVLAPPGTFTMGSRSDEPGRQSDETQHEVTLTQPFYLQITEVTQAQWEAVMGSNPSYNTCSSCPVENVSWNDVHDFISRMNARGEGTYALPTEAQWEYAARAGSTTAFANGEIRSYPDMNECNDDVNLNAMGWYCHNSDDETHSVAQKAPNVWGIYDMHGNVWEWCRDWYDSNYYSSSAMTDPMGPSSGSDRVMRSAGKGSSARSCRSANRHYASSDDKYSNVGFRLLWQPSTIPGAWPFAFDWSCNGSSDTSVFYTQNDGTFNTYSGSYGTWTLYGNHVTFVYSSGTTYSGTVDSTGTRIEGTMVSHSGSTGCWSAEKTRTVAGTWPLTFDWSCDGSSGTNFFYIYNDGTFYVGQEGSYGTWTLLENQITLVFSSGTTYVGTVDSTWTRIEGTMESSSGESTGCWSAEK